MGNAPFPWSTPSTGKAFLQYRDRMRKHYRKFIDLHDAATRKIRIIDRYVGQSGSHIKQFGLNLAPGEAVHHALMAVSAALLFEEAGGFDIENDYGWLFQHAALRSISDFSAWCKRQDPAKSRAIVLAQIDRSSQGEPWSRAQFPGSVLKSKTATPLRSRRPPPKFDSYDA